MDIKLIIRKNKKGLWYIIQQENNNTIVYILYLISIHELSEFDKCINYIQKHFNAKMRKNLFFETKEDAEKAKEWIESIITIHALAVKN